MKFLETAIQANCYVFTEFLRTGHTNVLGLLGFLGTLHLTNAAVLAILDEHGVMEFVEN
jgi:hypothetical protein